MLLLASFVVLLALFFNSIYPFFYTFGAINFTLSAAVLVLLFTNITLVITLFVIYYLIPTEIMDYIFETYAPQLAKTFQFKDIVEQNIRATFPIHILYPIPERSIRIWHPHGSGATTIGLHNVFRITDHKLTKTKTVIHYIFTLLPIVRDMVRYGNCISSDYRSIVNALKTDSITVGLGGVDEMGRVKHKQLELVIKKRKGIFKIALETGTPIVPVLTYGENEIFPLMESDFLKWLNDSLYSTLKGRFYLPSLQSIRNWANLLVRPLDPVQTYTGRPIYVKKIEKPTEKHIEILRKIYIKRVRELFSKTNPGDFTLKIV
jgi:2-acylglycerol O-acyltransferase 2